MATDKANLQFWAYVELTCITNTTGSTTTIKLSNRPVLSETGYYPILVSIDGVGSGVGDVMPITASGSIIINNAPNSLGFERRFSDLFERYTFIDQQVVIYSAFTPIGDNEITTDKLQDFKGKIQSYRINPSTKTVELSFAGYSLKKRDVNRLITSSDVSASTGSIGQALPIVFGLNQSIKPIKISTGSTSTWAYATTFNNQFAAAGVSEFYAKNTEGNYESVGNATSTASAQFALNGSITAAASSTVRFYEPLLGVDPWSHGFYFKTTGTEQAYVATQMRFNCYGRLGYAGSVDGKITISIWEIDPETLFPVTQVGTAFRFKSDFDANLRTSTPFDIDFLLSKPIVFSPTKSYAVTIEESKTDGEYILHTLAYRDGSSTSYYRLSRGSYSNEKTQTYSPISTIYALAPGISFFCVHFTDSRITNIDTDGFGMSQITATQKGGFTNLPDLSKIDLVVSVNGITDDAFGTITGSVGAYITGAYHQAKLLTFEYNGSSWIAGPLDESKFSSTQAQIGTGTTERYYRASSGFSTGRTSADALISQILKNAGAKLALVNSTTSGKYLGLYAWGKSQTSQAVLTDEDCIIEEVQVRGTETIVNKLRANYGRTIINYDPLNINIQKATYYYSGLLDWRPSNNSMASWYSTVSLATFGERLLSNQNWDWISDQTSAEHFAEFLLANFAKPSIYIKLRAPLDKYRTLEIMDVIEILHPDMPAFFGTSADPHVGHYLGAEMDVLKGFPLKRAQRYRAQIEARDINYNFGGVPEIAFTARLLINSPQDPT